MHVDETSGLHPMVNLTGPVYRFNFKKKFQFIYKLQMAFVSIKTGSERSVERYMAMGCESS